MLSLGRLEIVSKQYRDLDALMNHFSAIAAQCDDGVDGRWCLYAFQRALPLYSFVHDEVSQERNLTAELMTCMKSDIIAHSSALQEILLASYLSCFHRSTDTTSLVKYEQLYSKCHKSLNGIQRARLQTEYAACTYRLVSTYKMADLKEQKLIFPQLVSEGEDLIAHDLFRNDILIAGAVVEKIEKNNMGSVLRWLCEYMTVMLDDFVKEQITGNPLRLLLYRAILGVAHNKVHLRVHALARNAIRQALDERGIWSPAFFCRLTELFRYCASNENLGMMRECVEEAIKAEDMALRRNALGICYCIYHVYYYYETGAHKARMKELMEKMGEVTGVGKAAPQLHWINYAGVVRYEEEVEQAFLEATWKTPGFIKAVSWGQGGLGGERFQGFPASWVDVCKKYEVLGSIYANALLENVLNPEAWNTIATTVFNSREDAKRSELEMLERAAFFYRVTGLFARERHETTQKYAYNYIRCQGLYLLGKKGREIDSEYVAQVAEYLAERKSEFFAETYKEQCLEPFVNVVRMQWSKLPVQVKEKMQVAYKKRWNRCLKELCQKTGFDPLSQVTPSPRATRASFASLSRRPIRRRGGPPV